MPCNTKCLILLLSFTVSPVGSVAISPLDIVTTFGDNVTLTCTAMGDSNATFVWEKNGTIVGHDSILTLTAIDVSYGGDYSCTVSNAAGTDTVSTTLYVAPYIITPLEDQTLARNGSIVNIRCDAAGFPTPVVNWVNSLDVQVSSTAQLKFSPVIFGNEDVYRCLASTVIDGQDYNITDQTTLIGKITFYDNN